MSRNGDVLRIESLACHEVLVRTLLVDIGKFIIVAEVKERYQLFILVISSDSKYMIIVGFNDPRISFTVEYAVLFPYFGKLRYAVKKSILSCALFPALLGVI